MQALSWFVDSGSKSPNQTHLTPLQVYNTITLRFHLLSALFPWLILTLVNIPFSAFPTGGYSHSYGFESASKHGFMTDLSECATQIINTCNYFGGIILICHNCHFFIYNFSIDTFKVFVLSCLQNAGMLTGTHIWVVLIQCVNYYTKVSSLSLSNKLLLYLVWKLIISPYHSQGA